MTKVKNEEVKAGPMEDPKTDAPTLTQKLFAIMGELDRIGKDGTNEFHKYKYTSEKAIKEAVHPLLVKHRVMFGISIDSVTQTGDITLAQITYRFVDVDTDKVLTATFYGSGQDKGDKGLYKAITGAIKYIMTSTFLIPTGDDPERDEPAPKAFVKAMPKAVPQAIREPLAQYGKAVAQRAQALVAPKTPAHTPKTVDELFPEAPEAHEDLEVIPPDTTHQEDVAPVAPVAHAAPVEPPRKLGAISQKQVGRLLAIGRSTGRLEPEIRDYVEANYSRLHLSDIHYKEYEAICTWAATSKG